MIDHPKIEFLPSFTHPVSNLYEFRSSVEHKSHLKKFGNQKVDGSYWLP